MTSYKPYPACRGINGVLDCLSIIVERENLHPEEIQSIKAYLETIIAEGPVYQNREIENQSDPQMSIPYLLSLVAHRIKPSAEWHEWKTVKNPQILKFMDKISYEVHPKYVETLQEDPRARLSRVDVVTKGETFTCERKYPKGSPSPDDSTYTTNAELVSKFKDNALCILPLNKVDNAISELLELENADDIGKHTGKIP